MMFMTQQRGSLKVQIHPIFMKDTKKQNIFSNVKFYEKDI